MSDPAGGDGEAAWDLFSRLEEPPSDHPEFARVSEQQALAEVQVCLDMLTEEPPSGGEEPNDGEERVALLWLASHALDELLIGLHCCRHGFVSQAHAHCRGVSETVNKLILFRRDRSALSLWMSDDQKRARAALSAFQIRKRLGREAEGEAHALHSAIGVHVTFLGSVLRTDLTDSSSGRVTVKVGGWFSLERTMPVYIVIALEAARLSSEIVAWQRDVLGVPQQAARRDAMFARYRQFVVSHAIPWLQENGAGDDAKVLLQRLEDLR